MSWAPQAKVLVFVPKVYSSFLREIFQFTVLYAINLYHDAFTKLTEIAVFRFDYASVWATTRKSRLCR